MQDPNKRRKKRGKLYFSSTKALKTSRMGRKKVATERYETEGINKVLDFEDTGENATLSTVDEYTYLYCVLEILICGLDKYIR